MIGGTPAAGEGDPNVTAAPPANPSTGAGLRFSVVVPALNEAAVLADCLTALQRQTFRGGYEIIVVDNGSTDGTGAIAERFGARLISEPRRGVCFARQRGLSEARGEIVVSTDADTVTPPSWLERIDAEFTARPEAVGVAGPCAYVDGPWWSRWWGPLLFGLVWWVARLTGRVVYVTATNLAFRRSSFVGYDTRMTQGGDELDVLHKLRRRGRVVIARGNGVATSARRLERGLVHTVVVSLCWHYVACYALNRIAGRPVVGTAPAYRAPAALPVTPSHHVPTATVERPRVPEGAVNG
jgi:glycosyltransferase involved in cell wall biosynthesis